MEFSKVCNLTKDPELHYTPQGKGVCEFGIAFGPEGKTTFFDVEAWNGKSDTFAENIASSLHKGDRVYVGGFFVTKRWEYQGRQISKTKVVAQVVAPDLRYVKVTIVKAVKEKETTEENINFGEVGETYDDNDIPFG